MNQEDLQKYFKYRMSEILHKDTLDSFRVRTNNSLTILNELKNVLENWIHGNIKHYTTVEYCVDECLSLIQNDECLDFSFYDKDLFVGEITDFKTKQKDKKQEICYIESKRLLYFINLCIESNNNQYLNNLVDSIESQLTNPATVSDSNFIPTLDILDKTISAFACELLRKGFSKVYLYSFFKSFKRNYRRLSFKVAFNELKEKLLNAQKKRYIVVFKLGFSSDDMAIKATSDIIKIEEEVPENLRKLITEQVGYREKGPKVRFYITEKEAFDSAMAAILSHDELSKDFDFNLNSIQSVVIPATALTFCYNVETSTYDKIQSEKVFVLDKGEWNDECQENNLYAKLRIIEGSTNVSQEVKDRIRSAIRHLRIGDYQSEIEQRFINYWIGLEFIFASASSNESTYERIKKYFIIVSQACYIKRNMKYLNNWLIKAHEIGSEEKYWEKNDADKDALIDSLDNILLKYRLKKMKAHLKSGDDVKNYLKVHKTNLEQHLARIYRLRNELIHEAAIKQDIANVTSNLRAYLVFILNQLINYFSDTHIISSVDMLQFQLKYESCVNLIKKNHSIEHIMAVPLTNGYIS